MPNSWERCRNCKFRENIYHDRDKINKLIAECDKRIEESQEKAKTGIFGYRMQSNAWMWVDTKRELQASLADIDEMVMCHRYPTTKKVGMDHWCGEFLGDYSR